MSLVLVEGRYSETFSPVHFTFYELTWGVTVYSASGFTTRSDIGPAREGPSEEVVKCVALL